MPTAAILESNVGSSAVVAQLGYIEHASGRPYDYAYAPPAGVPWQNYRSDSRSVRIDDARSLESAPTLSREGFRLCDAPTKVSDFLNEDAIRTVYYAEAADLARAATGAKSAYVFDHLVRKRDAVTRALSFGRRVAGDKPSANGRVHNDYTKQSGPRRMALVLRENAFAAGRYAIVNIWRPINGPVLDAPLALCDARSVTDGELVPSDVYYPTRTGEIYLARYSSKHRWLYYPYMHRGEALIFKQYDSLTGTPRFVPHAAFEHPQTPAAAPPRESIEVRCLVVFG